LQKIGEKGLRNGARSNRTLLFSNLVLCFVACIHRAYVGIMDHKRGDTYSNGTVSMPPARRPARSRSSREIKKLSDLYICA
jgi:hypothetical protein